MPAPCALCFPQYGSSHALKVFADSWPCWAGPFAKLCSISQRGGSLHHSCFHQKFHLRRWPFCKPTQPKWPHPMFTMQAPCLFPPRSLFNLKLFVGLFFFSFVLSKTMSERVGKLYVSSTSGTLSTHHESCATDVIHIC